MADVRISSVDKHTHDGELPVQLCNYTDVYRNDTVRPGPDLMRATATADEFARFRLEVGDSILTKDSEDPNDIGIAAHVVETASDFVCGYHLAMARPSTRTHPRYLTWALRSQPVLDHFSNHASGISRYGLTTAALRAAPVPWHEEVEQQRIADFLDDRVARIDQIITARRTQMASTRSHWAISMEPVLGSVTETTRASRVLRVLPGFAFPSDAYSEDPTDRRLLRGVNVAVGSTRWGEVTYWPEDRVDEFQDFVLQAGDVVLGMDRPWIGDGLRIACVTEGDGSPLLLQRVAKLSSEVLSSDYLYWAYQSQRFRDQVESALTGLSVPHLSGEQIGSYDLPICDSQRQAEIVAELSNGAQSMTRLVAGLGESIDRLSDYKQSLITAAVTGEIDVTTAGSGIPS